MSMAVNVINDFCNDGLKKILCEFVATPQYAAVCKEWREIMQQHFCSLQDSHVGSTSIQQFRTRALSMRLTSQPILGDVENQAIAASVRNTVLSVFRSLRSDLRSAKIGQFMFLSTSNIEKIIQFNKDANLVSFYNILQSEIAGPDFTEAGEIRDWMRTNSDVLDQIQYLNVVDQIITEIPEEINLLTNLEYLHLSHTQISALPEWINLPNLGSLDLSHTRIYALPKRINLPSLISLKLNHTQISDLPDWLNFPELMYLYLGHTQIFDLPDWLNFPELEYVDLSSMELSFLPDWLYPLSQMCLDLTSTELSVLPYWFDLSGPSYPGFRFGSISPLPERLNPSDSKNDEWHYSPLEASRRLRRSSESELEEEKKQA